MIGIGASAGGLEALEQFFRSMPENPGVAFVVIQHLSPDFKSHMDELLRRVTGLTVKVVEDGEPLEADTIYLIPPKAEMIVADGRLLLTERSTEKAFNHPIDLFFRSLSRDLQRYAIAVVLSGTGSDGSRGIIEIADQGGLVIAQHADSCKFDAMPLNAQNTGKVHLVLPAESMAAAIIQYIREGVTPESLREQQIGQLEKQGLDRVFQLLQRGHDLDFSHYKPGTVERRIQRRMELLGIGDLKTYVSKLNEDAVEINDLYKDLLIGVTRFFRDQDAFEFLQTSVLSRLIERHGKGGLRIWVCGCATGEEAYSLAICLLETYERIGRDPDFKMFATDAHQESLHFAANGVYSADALNDVSENRKSRFFRKIKDDYCVTNDVRRHIVFAPHNLISDPPFTQMHLVTCRNLLIYLQPSAQKKALSLFHFALKQGGVLFLGPSETPGELADEFEGLQKTWKIFRKRRNIRLPVDLRIPENRALEFRGTSALRPTSLSQDKNHDVLPSLYDAILGDMMPPSVLIDSQYHLLHAFPGSEDYLRIALGRPTTNVLNLVYPGIKSPFAAAVQHCIRDDKAVRYSDIPHPSDSTKRVCLIVRPYKIRSSQQDYLLVQFESVQAPNDVPSGDRVENVDVSRVAASRIEALEQDLSYTQQNLQATIEELETSNEELQATNEEMVASNEELQSTNEELHSVNEELYTVNAEHQKRVKELDEANSDMNNLLATTRVGVLFLDRDFYIRRFTPAIGQLLYMEPHDIGRNIDGFLSRINDKRFLERLEKVLDSRKEREWDVECDSKRYLLRAMPYWNGKRVDGVVISFINIDSIARAKAELKRFKFMADQNIDAQLLFDTNGVMEYVNATALKTLKITKKDIGKLNYSEIAGPNHPDYSQMLSDAKRTKGTIFEAMLRRSDDQEFPAEIAATYVEFDNRPFLFVSLRNITNRRNAESHRRLLEKAIASVENGIIICDARDPNLPITFANSGFTNITGYSQEEVLGRNCRFLQGPETDFETVEIIRKGIRRQESVRVLIKNYRKDRSAFWNEVYITPVRDQNNEVIAFVGVQVDLTEQIESNRIIEDRERTFRLLLDSTAEGIFGIDDQARCTFCNRSALNLLGYDDPSQLVGKDVCKMVHQVSEVSESDSEADCPAIRTLKTGQPYTTDHDVFWRSDGTSFPVQLWIHPVVENAVCTGAVVTFVDTTKRRNELKELYLAREEADAANAAKSRFLANMSHELRTPLSAILGFAQIMQEEKQDQESLDRLATIYRNGEYLLRLLNDVLDLSRIESGKVQTNLAVTRLDRLLGDIEETMQMRAVENQTRLTFRFRNPLPQTVTIDPARFRQIMINLVGNAIKFAQRGNVSVNVSMEFSNADSDRISMLIVRIEDDGIGMSQDQLRTLFQPFVQADSSIAKRFGGTGLGLSITERLVEVLDGEIDVESESGKGSTFTVRIPVDPIGQTVELSLQVSQDHHLPEHEDSKKLRISERKPRILVVDDMRDVRYIAEHFLKQVGCETEAAENGLEAIQKIEHAILHHQPYDLILMDIQMPEVDGETALADIRRRGIDTAVVALTADAMKGTRRRLITAGFDDYLSKPLDREKLLQIVRLLTDRSIDNLPNIL